MGEGLHSSGQNVASYGQYMSANKCDLKFEWAKGACDVRVDCILLAMSLVTTAYIIYSYTV